MPSVHYLPTASGIPESFLNLIEPDWSNGVAITYLFASQQSEGRTGIESRAPDQAALRIASVDLHYYLDASDADDIRKTLTELSDRRVAIPLPVEVSSDPADWVHAPQWRIGITDAATYELLPPAAEATMPWVAPLFIGRLKARPPVTPLGNGSASLSLSLAEDSPWAYRIGPAYAPETFPAWPFVPDWSEVSDLSRDQLMVDSIGQSREATVCGGDGTARAGQEARFTLEGDEIAQFIGWFAAARGSVLAFPMPVWYQPGLATPATPDIANFRFADDSIKVVYLRPGLAQVKARFWQEVPLLEGQPAQAIAPEAMLFTFKWDTEPLPMLLTSWEAPIITADGRTFSPAKIEYTKLRLTMTQLGDTCDIEIPEDELNNPFIQLRDGDAEGTLAVTVEQCDPSVSPVATTSTLFCGTARTPSINGNRLVAKCTVFGGVFQRSVPGYLLQVPCNYTVFSPNLCRLVGAAWATTGPLSGDFAGTTLQFDRTGGYAPAGDYASTWFAGGLIEVIDGDGRVRRRGILASASSGGGWSLRINRPLPVSCAGQVATARPGCDGRYSTCGGKYGNKLNFGGEPFMPEFIATSSGIPQKVGK